VTNDVSAATGGSSFAAAGGSDGARTVAASTTTVTPPAAASNLAMQVDCLLSAGMSANDVVVAMLGIIDAYGLTRVHVEVTYTSISASCYPARRARNLPGDSQSKGGWGNSVARARCRFGHTSWRHPRDLPRTPHLGPASPYPNAPLSTATQRGRRTLMTLRVVGTLARPPASSPAIGQ
jgi:hypothetical protein